MPMVQALTDPPSPAVTTPHRALDWADGVMAIFVMVWVSEAFVRLGLDTFFTATVYAYFVPRFLFSAGWLVPQILRIWPMLVYPALCTVSVAWSLVPQLSLVAAIQLWFTLCLGVFLGYRFRLSGLAALVMVGLGLTIVLSAMNLGGTWPPAFGPDGGFQGIYTNKNALGQRCALVILTALLFLSAQQAGSARVGWIVLVIAVAAVLVLSQSVTAGLLSVMAVGLFAALRLRGASMLAALIAGGTLALIGVVFLWIYDVALVEDGLAALGKTPTLTGRTMLWQIALERARDYPLLGVGYMAPWSAPEFAQEIAVINSLYGGTVAAFHNVFLEALVMLGPLGVLAMVLLIATSAVALWRHPVGALRDWGLILFGLLVASALLGSSLYRPHELTLLMVVAFAAAAPGASGAAPPAARSGGTTDRPARARR